MDTPVELLQFGVLKLMLIALYLVKTTPYCLQTKNVTPNPSYSDKIPTQGIKATEIIPSFAECVSFCVFKGAKTSMIYDPADRTCYCHHLPLAMLVLQSKPGAVAIGEVTQPSDTVVLWIASILDESSHFSGFLGITNYPSTEMIGPADYYPDYGNTEKAWCPKKRDKQYVELKISESIYITELHIYEVFWAGAVQTLSLLDHNSIWIPIWTSPALQKLEYSRIFSPDFISPSFKSDSIRIDLDLSITNEWAEFDAVRVIGTRSRSRNSL